MITNVSVLQYFDSAKSVILQVDASDDGLGGALMQCNRPGAYTLSTMTKLQKENYGQIEIGCLAIVNVLLGSVVIWPPVHYNRNRP